MNEAKQAVQHHTDTANNSQAKEFFAGAAATFPLLVGAAPFGIIFGTLAEPNGLSALGAILMSLIVFAGASQFIALSLLAVGASIPIIIATTFIVNFRHILYSANLVSKVKHLPHHWRAIMAFGLTDETFAAVNNRYMQQGNLDKAHWFYLGSFLAMYSNWVFCTYIGLTLGNIFPQMQNWGLDFAMSVTFLGMVVPYLKSKPIIAAVLVSAVLAIVSYDFAHKLGLLFASFSGIAVGISLMMLENRKQVKSTSPAKELS
jgi:4-azaleucine resistance transporter AzlC